MTSHYIPLGNGIQLAAPHLLFLKQNSPQSPRLKFQSPKVFVNVLSFSTHSSWRHPNKRNGPRLGRWFTREISIIREISFSPHSLWTFSSLLLLLCVVCRDLWLEFPLGHNMSQTDGNSMGGESGPVGHTGTGCYKNHDHSMMLHPQQHHGTSTAAATNRLVPLNAPGGQRRASATTGAISIAAVTALLTSSPVTNVSGIAQQQPPPPAPSSQQQQQPTTPNNLVDLGKTVDLHFAGLGRPI